MMQTDSEGDLGYSVSRVRSSGGMERIEGTRWSLSGSGDLRYRNGDAYQNHPEYEEIRPNVYRLMLQRPIEDGGFLRFGRFVPVELPGVGYVDGFQGETRRGEGLRLGVIGGFRPDRIDLEASVGEPFATGYASVEAGRRGASYYSGTVGLLNSYYEGELTRLDAFAEYRVSSALGLRAGADHWERPDNQAERDLLAFEDERFFADGYWRYWVGSYQRLPWSLRLYEELALIDSDTSEDNMRWQVRVTRTGLFDMRNANASLTVYGLTGDDTDGYGLRASGYLPFGEWLAVQPAAGFRTLRMGSAGEDATLTYLSLYLDGHLSRTWSLFGSLDYHTGDGVDAMLIEIGLRYLW